jgi:hypothetical protein
MRDAEEAADAASGLHPPFAQRRAASIRPANPALSFKSQLMANHMFAEQVSAIGLRDHASKSVAGEVGHRPGSKMVDATSLRIKCVQGARAVKTQRGDQASTAGFHFRLERPIAIIVPHEAAAAGISCLWIKRGRRYKQVTRLDWRSKVHLRIDQPCGGVGVGMARLPSLITRSNIDMTLSHAASSFRSKPKNFALLCARIAR